MLVTALIRLFTPHRAHGARLLALFSVLVALLSASEASASVPMCSHDARTIAAPPIGTPNRGLVLDAPKRCPVALAIVQGLPPEPGAPSAIAPDAPPRAIPVEFRGVIPPAATLTPVEESSRSTRSGVALSIYRPPRR